MSMGWVYVSELRPPTDLLFIPQVIHEPEYHGGMMSTEENSSFVYQSSVVILPVESSGIKQEERAKRMMNLTLRNNFVYTRKWFFACRKILHGASGFTSPLKEGVLRIFIASAGFEPTNLGSNGKHANHYSSQATRRGISCLTEQLLIYSVN
jgi:hypothetical protein